MLRVNPRNSREVERAREDWTGPNAELPQAFVLIGYGSPYVLDSGEPGPLVIDAEGVVYLNGEVITWCRAGCCATNPRRWPSVREAAYAHSSYVVRPGGSVQHPDDLAD